MDIEEKIKEYELKLKFQKICKSIEYLSDNGLIEKKSIFDLSDYQKTEYQVDEFLYIGYVLYNKKQTEIFSLVKETSNLTEVSSEKIIYELDFSNENSVFKLVNLIRESKSKDNKKIGIVLMIMIFGWIFIFSGILIGFILFFTEFLSGIIFIFTGLLSGTVLLGLARIIKNTEDIKNNSFNSLSE